MEVRKGGRYHAVWYIQSVENGISIHTNEVIAVMVKAAFTALVKRFSLKSLPHMMLHELLSFFPLVCTLSATRAASVKASLTPRFFMAEHSVRDC